MLHYYDTLLQALQGTALDNWAQQLPEAIQRGLCDQRYGDLPQWRDALASLSQTSTSSIELKDRITIGLADDCDHQTVASLESALRALIPWRKGPFNIHGIHIDTEWRSDWKWDRVLPHLTSLENRNILDIGCGNGYHCLRSYGAGARRVIGIDPSPRFIVQFLMIKHFLGNIPVDVLPLGIESLPKKMEYFDTTFSMGVFYHRRSPMDHLRELKETLKPGGQLVLETLLIDGKSGEVLVPEGRYAMMNNVWFIPSAETLMLWLTKCGFKHPRLVDSQKTSLDEQRATDWMQYHSLAHFLDPADPNKTIEGYPAPLRGIFIAES